MLKFFIRWPEFAVAFCALLRRRVMPVKGPLALFNRFLEGIRGGHAAPGQKINRYAATTLLVILAAVAITWLSYQQLPDGFMPQEDDGYLFINVQLPEGAALPKTQQVMRQMFRVVKKNPAVEDVINITGFSLEGGGNAPNSGFAIVLLKGWRARVPVTQILPQIQQQLATIPSANIMVFAPLTLGAKIALEQTPGGNRLALLPGGGKVIAGSD
ncbi:efflux RND transporter permease subunit [Kalamiella sp. sgz302252]|uniref:efflux RND transporter permease subunit n=1 Tax=Pantoea sp. sgz302252 TaxID=3341827 RepID=UPI0036D373A5